MTAAREGGGGGGSERGSPAAVVFDCLGTLLSLEPPGPRLRAELERRGIEVSPEAAAAAFAAEIDYYLEHHLEGSDPARLGRLRDACARVVADALGLPGERLAETRGAMLAALSFTPFEDAAPALEALRAGGLRLVTASNWDCSLPRVLERVGLGSRLDAVVTSAEVGAAKPDPAVFRAATDAVGVPGRAAVCVGDSLERDLAGAHAAGMAAILLDRSGELSEVAAGGVPVVRSLDEARSLILPGE